MTRLMILAGIAVLLAVTVLPTLRSYLSQRGHIAAMREAVTSQTAVVEDLIEARRRWNDPAYVEQQARERLKFVRPGETSYSVLDAPGAVDAGSQPAGSDEPPSWYQRVWTSMADADTAADPGLEVGAGGSAPGSGTTGR